MKNGCRFSQKKKRVAESIISDNFLRAWLGALATPASAVHFTPVENLVAKSDERLMTLEGYAFEKLVGVLYEERSRKGVGDFSLSERIAGYWDRSDVEIDLVAVDEPGRRIRFGNCKRSSDRLMTSLPLFEKQVQKFLEVTKNRQDWQIEKVCLAPLFDVTLRKELSKRGYQVQDLPDLCAGLR